MKLLHLVPLLTLLLLFVCQTAMTSMSGIEGDRDVLRQSRNASSKIAYPKKVTSLKKRRTKLPTMAAIGDTVSSPPSKTRKKNAADVTAAFKDLPDDDFEFIKELDMQFKLHGGKIKIKVEHETSNSTKNSKRTIDGELGYGYQSQHNGYDYSRPKFMFYPYSQQDIAPDAPGYYPPKASVDIQPSYSYELKPETSYLPAAEQPQIDLPPSAPGGADDEGQQHQYHHQQPQQQHSDEPVIVLRIPGPAKYATHLQALLQQYLEIRAAQYLQILEEADQRKQQQQQQQYQQIHHQEHHQEQHHVQQHQQQQHQQQQQAYEPEQAQDAHVEYQPPQQHYHTTNPAVHHQPHHAEVAYAHQMAPTPQPVLYPDIHDVYQSYKGRHRGHAQHNHQMHAAAPVYYAEEQAYQHAPPVSDHQAPAAQHAAQQQQEEEAPQQVYFTHHEQVPDDHIYQQYYLISMSPDGQSYADPQQAPNQQTSEEQTHQHQLSQLVYESAVPPISENSPRKTHTKVIFTPNGEHSADDYSPMHALPSIRPYERHASTSAPIYHQDYEQQGGVSDEHMATSYQEGSYSHAVGTAAAAPQETVAITQRPFNYHAHALKAQRGRTRGAGGSGNGRKRGANHTKRSNSASGGSTRTASASTTTAPKNDMVKEEPKTDEQLQIIREYVRDNLGARMGKAVEFQTRQVVEV